MASLKTDLGKGIKNKTRGDRRVILPQPMEHQRPVLESPARFKVVCCGRRWGKSLSGLCAVTEGHGPEYALRGALNGGTIWWVAPSYPLASLIWNDLKYALAGAWDDKSEMERRIFLPGGGSVAVRSSDNYNGLRGAGLDGVVLDEAAFMEEQAWTEALRPALADKGGWAMFFSTPQGRNWFWKLFEQAKSLPGWAAWQQPTSMNPRIPVAELEAAREQMSDFVYRQEFGAEFVSEQGALFHREHFRYYKQSGGTYVLGEKAVAVDACDVIVTCDIAASTKERADYTVFAAWAITPNRDLILVDLMRGRYEVPDQPAYLRAFYERNHPGRIFVETKGYQLGLAQAALREGLPMLPCNAPGDKWARAQPAAARMKAGTIWWPEGAPWTAAWERELLDFPLGEHDDQVDVLAYAAIQVADSYAGLTDYYRRLKGAIA